jgi:group I intron endonuclease
MTSAIYAIVNNVTHDMYVGSAVAVNRRWNAHRNLLAKQRHYNLRLQRAYNKYGDKAFDWEIVQFVDDKTQLIDREQFWMNFFAPKYNGRPIANSPLGTKASPETRAKMSASAKKRGFTEEHKQNISKAKKGICTMSEEQKKRLSVLNTGKVYSAETRAKISASGIGNTNAKGAQFSDVEKAKRSARMNGNSFAAGTQYTTEQRAIISKRMKQIWADRKQQKEATK